MLYSLVSYLWIADILCTSSRWEKNTCGMLLNRKTWSERVEPGKTSPPMAMPIAISKAGYNSTLSLKKVER